MRISGEIRIRRFSRWDGVEFVEARDVAGEVPRHAHDSFCVGLVKEGSRKMRFQDRSVTYGPDSIWLIRPRESHNCVIQGKPHSYTALCFEPTWAATLFGANYDARNQISDPTTFPDWYAETKEVFALLSLAGSILEAETPLMLWLGKYFFAGNDTVLDGWEIDSVQIIRAYLDEHYADHPSIVDLAGIAGFSPFHLERIFQKNVGMPMHLYQKMVRLRRARKLLREGKTISFTAIETGFADQSHFSRTFKETMGITPGEYARTCGES